MGDNSPDAPLSKERVEQAIHHATSGLSHPEDRPGQREMAFAVMDAINSKQPLIVQAGEHPGAQRPNVGKGQERDRFVEQVLRGETRAAMFCV